MEKGEGGIGTPTSYYTAVRNSLHYCMLCVQGEVMGYHSQEEHQKLGLNQYELLKMMKSNGAEFVVDRINDEEEFDEVDMDMDDQEELEEDLDDCCECRRESLMTGVSGRRA